jgi:hypothetical protein
MLDANHQTAIQAAEGAQHSMGATVVRKNPVARLEALDGG